MKLGLDSSPTTYHRNKRENGRKPAKNPDLILISRWFSRALVTIPSMVNTYMNLDHQAIRLLSEQIGVVDTFRFINRFTSGHGNYAAGRDALFGDRIFDEMVNIPTAKAYESDLI